MSRRQTPKAKIYMKTEASTSTEAHQFISAAASCIEKESVNEQYQKGGLRETKDLSQTIGLFRKYLHAKAQPNLGKTNTEESEAIKRKSPPAGHPLVPPFFGCNFSRRPSFLEQKLLPAVGGDPTEASSAEAKSSKEQLTIFYGGTVHVYDNVPVEKVEAIMLLAGESNLSKPKPESKTPRQLFDLQSVCKLQADLPIARKLSLQHFLEKRRERIVNKSPYYFPLNTKQNKKNEATANNINIEGSKVNQSLPLSPFPSSLESFFSL